MTHVLIIFFWVLLIAIILYFPAFKASVQPFEDKSLNVFVWGDSLEVSILAEFEKKTGIKVNLSFFSSNEELQVKMKATGGHGYDLILPSDYTVALLIKDELLKPIDHGIDHRQVRLGLELSPAERLRWLEETMDERGRLVEQARRRRKGTTTIKR